MLVIEDLKQLHKVHIMIQQKKTGSPEEFASELCVSRRKMYYLLDAIKSLGAPISYSRTKHTFFYTRDFDMDISMRIRENGCEEWQELSGGYMLVCKCNYFCAKILHESNFFYSSLS